MNQVIESSFRDRCGFLFVSDNTIYRQVDRCWRDEFDFFIDSKLYKTLTEKGLLIPHEEVDLAGALTSDAYKILKPVQIPFISYPYEWAFSQLKDAALNTLEIQIEAMRRGMTLKDASAYNVQFLNGKPIFIDTLSFKKLKPGKPWDAYRQFCQHFFAPLTLMSKVDCRLSSLSRIYIDGVPLDLAAKLLSSVERFSFPSLVHIFMHSKAIIKYGSNPDSARKKGSMGRYGLQGLVENLKSAIERLKWQPSGTQWAEYYQATNYSDEAMNRKMGLLEVFVKAIEPRPKLALDLGANDGTYSRILGKHCNSVISADIDHAAVEKNYLRVKTDADKNIYPIVLDIGNPSPDIGWANLEREAFFKRKKFDLVVSLALIHHLAISNNVPMKKVARFFHGICSYLIIEFVPKEDSQVQMLLSTRKDIFPDYNLSIFEHEFSQYFDILKSEKVTGSYRTMFLLGRK